MKKKLMDTTSSLTRPVNFPDPFTNSFVLEARRLQLSTRHWPYYIRINGNLLGLLMIKDKG